MQDMASSQRRKPLVLRFLSRMAIGGVQNGIIETLSRADRDRFDFAVLCYKKAGSWAGRVEELGIPVRAQKTLPVWDPYQILRLSRVIRGIRPDLMHIYQAPSVIAGATAGRLAGVRRFVIQHTSLYERHWREQKPILNRWEWRLTRGADARIAVSDAVADCTRRGMGLDESEIEVVWNGINLERFAEAEAHDLRAELNIVSDTPIVGYVSRFQDVKRIEDFIEAAAIIGRSATSAGVRPRPVFLIIGGGPDPLSKLYRRLADEVKDVADVRFLGGRHDLPSLLPSLDVGVLASEIEGCPNTILEYMCARVPIAATNIRSVADIVENERDALLSPPRDPKALAASITRLLDDPELCRRLTTSAREKAPRYDWRKTESAYERIYERVLSRG